jgi:hypothetical protein
MEAGPTFGALMAQPGPESATPAPTPGGGTILPDAVQNVVKTAPVQQARIAYYNAMEAVKKLAHNLARERNVNEY